MAAYYPEHKRVSDAIQLVTDIVITNISKLGLYMTLTNKCTIPLKTHNRVDIVSRNLPIIESISKTLSSD